MFNCINKAVQNLQWHFFNGILEYLAGKTAEKVMTVKNVLETGCWVLVLNILKMLFFGYEE